MIDYVKIMKFFVEVMLPGLVDQIDRKRNFFTKFKPKFFDLNNNFSRGEFSEELSHIRTHPCLFTKLCLIWHLPKKEYSSQWE